MWFISSIISWLGSISDYFYDAYREVIDWVWPFYYLAYPLYYLYIGFYNLANYFGYFGDWVNDVAAKAANILSLTQIYSYFSYYFDAALNAWDWVVNAFGNVWTIVDDWWSSVRYTVLAWVEEAKSYAAALVDNVSYRLSSLQSAWDNFKGMIPSISEIIAWFANWWAKILANIISWGALPGSVISTLIDSKIRDWFPFYDDLAALWGDIVLFFTDPLQWLYDRAEEFFDRFW